MGQLFTLALIPASFRYRGRDYRAFKASLPGYPVSTPFLFELSRSLRTFPASLGLIVSNPRKVEVKGGLSNVQ